MSARPLSDDKIGKATADFLVCFPFFETLTSQDILIIAEHINFLEIEEGALVFREGEEGDCVYFVIQGELEVIKRGALEGKEGVVISTLSKGRSIGEMSVIDKTPHSATVRARTRSTVVTLSAEGFDIILEKHPGIGIKILKGLSRLLSLNLRKTSTRLAEYMLPLS
jgi:CRP/FNR family transcriptional regulator, cyclic AMP receptor protein